MEAEEDRLWREQRDAAYKEADIARDLARKGFEVIPFLLSCCKAATSSQDSVLVGLCIDPMLQDMNSPLPPEILSLQVGRIEACSPHRQCSMQEQLWAEAAASVSDMQSNMGEHHTQEQHEWEGILQFAQTPAAGKNAVLLYNKASGAIR